MYVHTVLQCRTVVIGVSSFQECPYRGVPLQYNYMCAHVMYILYMYVLHILYCNAQDGHLRPGDQILEVDGTDLLGCTQER